MGTGGSKEEDDTSVRSRVKARITCSSSLPATSRRDERLSLNEGREESEDDMQGKGEE